MIRFVLCLLFFVLCVSCVSTLRPVQNVPRESEEAVLFVVRDDSDASEIASVFVDSLLVGKTIGGRISEITVPAGEHVFLFDREKKFNGFHYALPANSVLPIKEHIINAYVFTRHTLDMMSSSEFELAEKQTSRIDSYRYYEAKKKMSTGEFIDHVRDDVDATGFKLVPGGFKIRIKN